MNNETIIYRIVRRLAWEIFRVFPIKKNKIVLSSYYGKGYSDNLKYITDELLKDDKYEFVWIVKDLLEAKSLPKGVSYCMSYTINHVYQLSTAAIWLDNCRKNFHYKKRKQFYIQTYHGGGAGKRCERDVEEKLNKDYVKMSIKDAMATDLMISSDGFLTNLYHTSFWYDGPVAETGYPRFDILFKEDHSKEIEKIRNFFGVKDDTRFILYAPTFRHDYSFDAYDLNYTRIIDACERKFKKNYVVLVHLHPNVATKFEQLEFNTKVINATVYNDMQELMAASDILIGDYSSVNYEFSLMRRPVFRFAIDVEDYCNDRDMYYSIYEYPYPLAESNDQLVKNIEEFDEKKYLEKLEDYFMRVGAVFNTHAAKDCADIIRDYYNCGMDKQKFFETHNADFK